MKNKRKRASAISSVWARPAFFVNDEDGWICLSGGTSELRNRSERSAVFRDLFVAPEFFFASFFCFPRQKKEESIKETSICEAIQIRFVDNHNQLFGNEIPAFSFCDKCLLSRYYLSRGLEFWYWIPTTSILSLIRDLGNKQVRAVISAGLNSAPG